MNTKKIVAYLPPKKKVEADEKHPWTITNTTERTLVVIVKDGNRIIVGEKV